MTGPDRIFLMYCITYYISLRLSCMLLIGPRFDFGSSGTYLKRDYKCSVNEHTYTYRAGLHVIVPLYPRCWFPRLQCRCKFASV